MKEFFIRILSILSIQNYVFAEHSISRQIKFKNLKILFEFEFELKYVYLKILKITFWITFYYIIEQIRGSSWLVNHSIYMNQPNVESNANHILLIWFFRSELIRWIILYFISFINFYTTWFIFSCFIYYIKKVILLDKFRIHAAVFTI